jgi:DNA-binding LytR/AlgR family response regulator
MVWLDPHNHIMAMNGVAMDVLNVQPGELIGREILSIHPPQSREKVRWLLEQSENPGQSPPPMTMMINIPERVLMIKVSKMRGKHNGAGTCMIFYDLTELATVQAGTLDAAPGAAAPGGSEARRLYKLPVYKDQKVLLIDLEEVCCIRADGKYSTLFTPDGEFFCNLAISELAARLDEHMFIRVHRSHIANLRFARSFEKIDDQCFLVMDHGDTKIPISRNKIAALKQMLGLG